MWKIYALLSALFASLTAIFAKIGVKDIDSNLATAIRTTIILILTWGIVAASTRNTSLSVVTKVAKSNPSSAAAGSSWNSSSNHNIRAFTSL